MLLHQLLIDHRTPCLSGITVHGLCIDSRQLNAGDLFFAYPGEHSDGRDFMQIAAEAGAAAIVYDPINLVQKLPKQCPCIPIPNVQTHISQIAHRYANEPSKELTLIGITGTNGKTSVSHYVSQALNALEHSCAVIGTLGAGIPPKLTETGLTTPDALTCVQHLRQCLKHGATHLAMEISSHALCQHRVAGLHIPIGVFTNLSQDHLDYHGNWGNYIAAKALLWKQQGMQTAVINWDDAIGQSWLESTLPLPHCIAYSCNPEASIPTPAVQLINANTVRTPWGDIAFQHALIGDFNDANLLAVIAVLGSLGISSADIGTVLPRITAVPGRMESLTTPSDIRVVIDYAHTPDALEKALLALRSSCKNRLICVFGCGGNRDQNKRSLMGSIASTVADTVIITNDNPRHEDPERIANAIFVGTNNEASIILDRKAAIIHAMHIASLGDTILIAGKGHETTQVIGDETLAFSDRELVSMLITKKHGTTDASPV